MTFQTRADIPDPREAAAELGCGAVDAATGSVLRFLACSLRARTAVEVGTGAGVSGLYLLRGMPADGVLTSIDIEPQRQRSARASFASAGFGPSRSRLITGRAVDVLPRLATGGYDLVLLDTTTTDYPHCLQLAVPLLRTGGVVAFHIAATAGTETTMGTENTGAAGDGPVADRALRALSNAVRSDERLVPACLPLPCPLLLVALGG